MPSRQFSSIYLLLLAARPIYDGAASGIFVSNEILSVHRLERFCRGVHTPVNLADKEMRFFNP
jgi:hypothetical protein